MTTTPEPGGTPGTPGTARTKRIAALLAADPEAFDWITAEAARSERERLRVAVEGLLAQDVQRGSAAWNEPLDAVLALIAPDRRP